VGSAYRTILRRDPDVEGLGSYLSQLRSGASKVQLLRALAASQEAVDRGYSGAILEALPPADESGLRHGVRRLFGRLRGGGD
jgi:hypothetical protein